jgi:hypothetical protein
VLCQIQQADFRLKDKEGVFYKLKDLFLLFHEWVIKFKLVLFAKTVKRIKAMTHVMGKIKRGVHHECKQ